MWKWIALCVTCLLGGTLLVTQDFSPELDSLLSSQEIRAFSKGKGNDETSWSFLKGKVTRSSRRATPPLMVQKKKSWINKYMEEVSHVRFNEDTMALPSYLELEPGVDHKSLTTNLWNKAFQNNSVLMFGDSTIRGLYELWSALNKKGANAVYQEDDYSLFSADSFSHKYRCSSGNHYDYNNISTPHGTMIGYFGYYWMMHDPFGTMDRIYRLMENYDMLLWNVGLHLLFDGEYFQNATLLYLYKNFTRSVVSHMINQRKPVIFITTNPVCSDMYDGEFAAAKELLIQKDPNIIHKMQESSKGLFADAELPYLTYLNNDGSVTLNHWMKEITDEFKDSPYVWIFDRFSILNETKCQWTTWQDGRHYEKFGYVTTTALLNIITLITK